MLDTSIFSMAHPVQNWFMVVQEAIQGHLAFPFIPEIFQIFVSLDKWPEDKSSPVPTTIYWWIVSMCVIMVT